MYMDKIVKGCGHITMNNFVLKLDTTPPEIQMILNKLIFNRTDSVEITVHSNEPLANFQECKIIHESGKITNFQLNWVSETELYGLVSLSDVYSGNNTIEITLCDKVLNRVTVSCAIIILNAVKDFHWSFKVKTANIDTIVKSNKPEIKLSTPSCTTKIINM